MIKGFFELKTPEDLLQKLRHDFEQMKTHPFNAYLAFNFFVTAEAMMDWVLPGDKNGANRRTTKESEWFLQATSDLASGAKHLELHSFHDTVDSVYTTAGYFPKNYFPKGAFPIGSMGDGVLMVSLTVNVPGEAKNNYTAFNIASRVLEYWNKYLTCR